MNKKLLSTIVFALIAMMAMAQESNYTINCDFTPVIEAMAKDGVSIDSFYLAKYGSWEPITKKSALQGNKAAISGEVTVPQTAALLLEMRIPNGVRTQRFPLILEAGNIIITLDERSFNVAGTPLNDALFGINSQNIALSVYGFSAIPEIILFAPDGTIVARGLRGDSIEKKLAEIFK